MKFKNKTVWITGASAGIGKASAISFAKQGAAKLILSARNVDKLQETKKAVEEIGAKAIIFPLDLEEMKDVSKITELINGLERIDLLFNNGGISQRAEGMEADISVDRRIMEVNFFGTIALTKLVLKKMVAQGGGNIAVTSSLTGKFGFPLRTAYAASKHALHGYFESLQFEHLEDSIFVTMICPGRIKTDISKNALTKDGGEWGKLDPGQEKGISVEACAEQIMRAIEKDKKEVVIGSFLEKVFVRIKRYTPALFRWLVPKVSAT